MFTSNAPWFRSASALRAIYVEWQEQYLQQAPDCVDARFFQVVEGGLIGRWLRKRVLRGAWGIEGPKDEGTRS